MEGVKYVEGIEYVEQTAVRFSLLLAIQALNSEAQDYKMTLEEISCLIKVCNLSVRQTMTMGRTLMFTRKIAPKPTQGMTIVTSHI